MKKGKISSNTAQKSVKSIKKHEYMSLELQSSVKCIDVFIWSLRNCNQSVLVPCTGWSTAGTRDATENLGPGVYRNLTGVLNH